MHLGMENFNCTFLQALFYNLQIFRVGRFYNENFKQPTDNIIETIINMEILKE